MRCPDCGLAIKSPQGLASHRRSKHPQDQRTGKNLAACETTLAALRLLGRLDEVDAARVELVRSLAAAVDAEPTKAMLWREYRESLEGLMVDDADDGELNELLHRLSAAPRDSSTS